MIEYLILAAAVLLFAVVAGTFLLIGGVKLLFGSKKPKGLASPAGKPPTSSYAALTTQYTDELARLRERLKADIESRAYGLYVDEAAKARAVAIGQELAPLLTPGQPAPAPATPKA